MMLLVLYDMVKALDPVNIHNKSNSTPLPPHLRKQKQKTPATDTKSLALSAKTKMGELQTT